MDYFIYFLRQGCNLGLYISYLDTYTIGARYIPLRFVSLSCGLRAPSYGLREKAHPNPKIMLPKVLIAASTRPIMLSILAQEGETYGYQIIQRIHQLSEGKMRWTAGTLYPVLHRMETENLIRSTWRVADSGRKRKYYTLTAKGHEALAVEKGQWLDVNAVLVKLWGPELAIG